MSIEQIYLVEITAATDAAGTLTTLRLTDSSVGFATRPAETPASTPYLPCLESPGYMRRESFSGNPASPAGRVGYGEVVARSTGQLDGIRTWGFSGRALIIRRGPSNGAYPGDFPAVFSGTVSDVSIGETDVRWRLRDKLERLRVALLTERYGGTNALPAGIDGTPDDIAGRVKPRVFGRVLNVAPPQVNTSRLIYQVGAAGLNDIPNVYDSGVALTRGADYASESAMQSTAPSAGQYRVWPAGGCVRLGSSPVGEVTCDATAGATTGDRTAAQVINDIALAAGLTSGEISAADITALDTAAGFECGLYIDDETTALDALGAIAGSVGADVSFDRLGVLRVARLAAPSGTPVATLSRTQIVGIDRQAEDVIPAWQCLVEYQRNGTVQTGTQLAGSVTAARRAFLAQEYRSTVAEDSGVLTQHLLSQPLTRTTQLLAAADADAQAASDLALFGTHRDTFRCLAVLSDANLTAVELGTVVQVIHPRHGLSAGRLLRVIGIQPDYASGETDLTLWG